MDSKKTTQERFNEIFAFKNAKDKLQFEAEMMHLDIMYEIQCLMEKHENMTKSELANKLVVSKGYLTQLFTGDKLINLKTMAKLQRIFNIKFFISHESIEKLRLQAMERNIWKTQEPFKINSNWQERIPEAKRGRVNEIPPDTCGFDKVVGGEGYGI